MDVGLVDLYTSGHHIPYANRIGRGLQENSEVSITFITLTQTERCGEYFDQNHIWYIEAPDSLPIDDRDGDFHRIADTAIKKFFENERAYAYDVVHFLFADDILGSLWRHCPDSNGPILVGELNGVFFKRGTILRSGYLHQIFYRMLQTKASSVIDTVVPDRPKHETLWRDLFLYRCLTNRIFDNIVVHSQEAEKYVSNLDTNQFSSVNTVAFAGPEDFGHDMSKAEARDRIGIDTNDRVLLFFGTLRKEKGIHRLLEAVAQYRGQSFTMVIAGPPISISVNDLETTSEKSEIRIHSELDFINSPEAYYRASDGVLLPYTQEFGKECTSQSLIEACSSMRPVIVPDFGAIGRATRQWELGITYPSGSTVGLIQAMREFANHGISFSREKMSEFNSLHNYNLVGKRLKNIYSETAERNVDT